MCCVGHTWTTDWKSLLAFVSYIYYHHYRIHRLAILDAIMVVYCWQLKHINQIRGVLNWNRYCPSLVHTWKICRNRWLYAQHRMLLFWLLMTTGILCRRSILSWCVYIFIGIILRRLLIWHWLGRFIWQLEIKKTILKNVSIQLRSVDELWHRTYQNQSKFIATPIGLSQAASQHIRHRRY